MEVNIWKRFSGLFAQGTRIVGRVTFINTVQGVSTIQLRDGSTFTAKGTSVPVNSNAIVADGAIVSPAPNLPQYDVVV